MPRSKTNKRSSSASKSSQRGSRDARLTAADAVVRPFSVWHYPFAVPLGLRTLCRVAAMVLVAGGLTLPAPAETGSLWKGDTARSMFADKRARAVGDILTILVQENTSATKDNSTKTSKKSSVNASIDTFFYSPAASGLLTKGGRMPAMQFGGAQDFDGGGKINNSERINGRLAVRVVDTLPNGNLIIEGRRDTFFSGEKQETILRGIVRGEDVMANNTVYSYNITDASIRFVSKGTISDNQRKGWLFRVWEKVTPF
jgi:flagellar L-ring protein precursor FlgH